jgi:ribose/xylose/arabinose/galactoside ABC-type transport system permease subunit
VSMTGASIRQIATSLSGLVAVFIAAAIFTPGFYAEANLVLVAQQIGFIGVAALGQTFCLLVTGIDLSVGAVSGMTMVVLAVVSGGSNSRLWLAILLAIGLGIGVGIVNAVLVTWRKAPPFVATFATFTLVEGALLAWTSGAPSGSIPTDLAPLGAGNLWGVPAPLLVFLGLLIVSGFVLTRTTYGRRLYATGSNLTTARMSGIPTRTLMFSAYVICAICAVLVGLLMSGYIGFVDYQLINTINLNCIAAAVIGGTTFAGGEGGVFRTTIGVVVLACLLSFMLLLNTGNAGQLILEGAVILGAVWLQTGTRSIRYRRRIAVAGIGEASIDNEVNVAPSHAVGVGIDKPTDNRGI